MARRRSADELPALYISSKSREPVPTRRPAAYEAAALPSELPRRCSRPLHAPSGSRTLPLRVESARFSPLNYRCLRHNNQGDGRDSNPLVSAFTAPPLDHFAFRRHHAFMWTPGIEPGLRDFQARALPIELSPLLMHLHQTPPTGFEPVTFRLTTGCSAN